MTQYEKIKMIHADGGWHCGNEYRQQFIFSAHKRRQEMIDRKMCLGFEWKPCEHGFKEVRDYRMLTNEPVNISPVYDQKSLL